MQVQATNARRSQRVRQKAPESWKDSVEDEVAEDMPTREGGTELAEKEPLDPDAGMHLALEAPKQARHSLSNTSVTREEVVSAHQAPLPTIAEEEHEEVGMDSEVSRKRPSEEPESPRAAKRTPTTSPTHATFHPCRPTLEHDVASQSAEPQLQAGTANNIGQGEVDETK
jgi:hypothetical protein